MKLLVMLIFYITLIQSCSDYTENLGKGYFYRHEGGTTNDILCNRVDGSEIPANVIEYEYDNNFIVAKQKPDIPPDILYKKTYNYSNGIDKFYYWVILKNEDSLIGPLDYESFQDVISKYKLPEKLILR